MAVGTAHRPAILTMIAFASMSDVAASGDPLSLDLKPLFRRPEMFDSPDDWRAAGFQIVRASPSEKKVIVAKHKSARGYLFKKYRSRVPLKDQLQKFKRRLEGASKLRVFIDEMKFKHVVVPDKWLYELPAKFTREMPAYLVIVEKLPLFDRIESARRHRRIDFDVLRELCEIFYKCKGLDFTDKNAPFTKQGQVAFIDTEYVDWQDTGKSASKRKKRFMKCAERYLSGKRLEFAEAQWEELSGGATR